MPDIIKKTIRTETKAIVIGFICNKCDKKVIASESNMESTFEVQERFRWYTIGGYGSIWGDGDHVEVVLCQKCAYGLLREYAKITEGEW